MMKTHRTTPGEARVTPGPFPRSRWTDWTTLAAAVLGVVSAAPLRAQPATLQITPTNAADVSVQWNTGGTLQVAPSIGGPWTTVSNGVSVLSSSTVLAGGPARFFRVVDNGVAGGPVPLLASSFSAPLQFQSGSIQLLPSPVLAGNSRLVVSFVPGQVSSSNTIALLLNNGLTLLRDDGVFPDQVANDGNFSALVNVSVAELAALTAAVTNLPPNERITQIFSGRAIIGSNVLQVFPISDFEAGQSITFFTNSPFGIHLCAGSSTAYDPAKTLMITDLSVVQDTNRTWDPLPGGKGTGTKMGAWTFGRLMTDMANTPVTGISASDFVLRWLQSWQVPQTINNDTVPAVPLINQFVVAPWQAATAAEGGFPPGAVDLSIAPFRLLAIVNRVDLRENPTYGGTSQNSVIPPELAGEARFVFGVLDSVGQQLSNTVILEYAVPKTTCEDVHNWGVQWAALNNIPFNTPPANPAFNIALQAITDQFAKANADPSRLPNMSAIHQVRSNEALRPDAQWELRQFNIDDGSGGNPGFLVESPVVGTPATSLNNSPTLNMFLLGIISPISFCPPSFISPPQVPTFFNSAPFLGGFGLEGFSGMFWDSDTPTPLSGSQFCVRHIFSLNTCSACHTSETGTSFTHVSPRVFGQTAQLSGFLTGITVPDPDPANSGVVYRYADLTRRVQDLNALVICPCFMEVATDPSSVPAGHH